MIEKLIEKYIKIQKGIAVENSIDNKQQNIYIGMIEEFLQDLKTLQYTEEREEVKKYKHKQLGWIAEYMEQDGDECNGRYFINGDEANTISREIVETGNDWEILV